MTLPSRTTNLRQGLHVRDKKFPETGSPYLCVYERSFLPDYHINLYLLVARDNIGLSYLTLKKDAEDLCWLKEWANGRGLNLEQRLLRGEILEQHEINDLAEGAWLLRKKGANIHKVERMPRHRTIAETHVVPATMRMRMLRARDYCEFWANAATREMSKTSETFMNHTKAVNRMIRWFNKRIPKGRNKQVGPPKWGLSEQDQKRLKAVIDPDHPDNPWKARNVKIRNQAMIMLQLELGIRAGELLSLNTTDLDQSESMLHIWEGRQKNDPRDRRKRPMQGKTLGRTRRINWEDVRRITSYIIEVRDRTPKTDRHDFLWVCLKKGPNYGWELSYETLKKSYHQLREVDGITPNITSHLLRHTANDNISRKSKEQCLSEQAEKTVRNHAMGWTGTSEMAAGYTLRSSQEQADEFTRNENEKFYKSLNTELDTEQDTK